MHPETGLQEETGDDIRPGNDLLRGGREGHLSKSEVWLKELGVTDDNGHLNEYGEILLHLLASHSAKPRYDADSRTLFWRDQEIKHLEREAANQEAVLLAFEKAGWPNRINDPLVRAGLDDPNERLRQTVKSLNKRLQRGSIRFHTDGSGSGVRWEEERSS